jgi:hypothetical protein
VGVHVGPMVHVKGRIEEILQDDQYGLKHQCVVLCDVKVLRIAGDSTAEIKPRVLCTIRYGEDLGTDRIRGLALGDEVEVQGEYLSEAVSPSAYERQLPVIHYTHKPMGFVVHDEHRYE